MNLVNHINQQFYLSLNSAKLLAEAISLKAFGKGEVFVKKNRPNVMEYLVIEGITRSYITDIKDKDITLSFFVENTAISPNVTRSNDGLSLFNIQALIPSTIACFSSRDLNALMQSNREIEFWANTILQRELLRKVNKEINQISLDARERLLEFRAYYPPLENLVSHSYIASYLGITTVSLSRIRKDLSHSV